MTNKKNKYHKKQDYSQPASKVIINQQELTNQCLEMHELLKNRTNKLRAMKNNELCYLLSTRWLQEWKEYVGYEQLVGDEEEKTSKKDKRFGKKNPGKINADIVAFSSQAKDFYQIPKEMEDYQYLNELTNQKKEKDDDFIAITAEIWFQFLNYYQGGQIRRPVKVNKGSTFYDGQPLRCDVIFADLEDENLEEKIKKTNKKNYNTLFPSLKMVLSNLWTFKDLKDFFAIYCGVVYGSSKIRIWKGHSYIATNPITEFIIQSVKDKTFLIKGRQLTEERYKDLEIDEYIKSTYTLIVEIGDILKPDTRQDEDIKGYCEECVEKKSLNISCVCNEVIYCSRKCRTNDQNNHFHTCTQAFDSEDDEEYSKKSVSQTPFSGLDNIGNTCYMNSTIQAFISLKHIRQFFSTNQYLNHRNEKELKDNDCMLLSKFSKTIKALIEEQDSYTPWPLKSQIDYNLSPFRGDKQHDANDFLVNFLNTINDYLKKTEDKAYHQILEPFVGQYYSKVLCPNCNGISQNNEIFLQISLPIKAKVIQKTFGYTVVESLTKIRRGKSGLGETWEETKSNVGAKQSLVCISKEGMGLIGLTIVDQQQESPEKVSKGKGDIIFFKDQVISQEEVPFVFGLVTTKVIAGSKLKSGYGVHNIIAVRDQELTLGTVWLQVIKKYFGSNAQIVSEAETIEKEYWIEIQSQFKQQPLPVQSKPETAQNQTNQEKEKLQNQRHNKIVDHYNTRLKLFAQKIGIQIFINHFKRTKNMCKFCNKKCNSCDLPQTFDKPFNEFFSQRYEEVRFEVFLRESLVMEYVNEDKCINGDPTLQDCLQLFTQPEELDEENAWYCDKCDSMALALKQLHVKSFPSILVLHLNRFKSFDNKKMKNSDPIQYQQLEIFGGKQYRLISAIIHEGSMDAGHYWCISLRDNQYYVFNDSKVTKIQRVFHRNAYILIYQLVDFTG